MTEDTMSPVNVQAEIDRLGAARAQAMADLTDATHAKDKAKIALVTEWIKTLDRQLAAFDAQLKEK